MDFDVHEKGKEPPPPPPPDPCGVKHRCILATGIREGQTADPALEKARKKDAEAKAEAKKQAAQRRITVLQTRAIESSAAGNRGRIEKAVNLYM